MAADNVTLVENTLTSEYLALGRDTDMVEVHGAKNSRCNIQLYNTGTATYLRVFGSPNNRLRPHNGRIVTTTDAVEVYSTPACLTTGVKLYYVDEHQSKWFLRINTKNGNRVELVQEREVANLDKSQEAEFDLVSVKANSLR